MSLGRSQQTLCNQDDWYIGFPKEADLLFSAVRLCETCDMIIATGGINTNGSDDQRAGFLLLKNSQTNANIAYYTFDATNLASTSPGSYIDRVELPEINENISGVPLYASITNQAEKVIILYIPSL